MKGPGIKDYLEYLTYLKKTAHDEGKTYIDISSRNLHHMISPNHATMPTCCQAIYKLMLEGDEILDQPRGQTGYGSRLLVRYYVDQLENRNAKFPPKKRGRPNKSDEEKLHSRLMKPNRSTSDLKELICMWLKEKDWKIEVNKDTIRAYKDDEIWLINIQGSRRGRKLPLSKKLNLILSDVENDASHYSIAFNESYHYKKQWNEIPRLFKDKLNVSLLFAGKNGKVTEYQ